MEKSNLKRPRNHHPPPFENKTRMKNESEQDTEPIDIDHEAVAERYKEKLIKLARAHAALLTVASRMERSASSRSASVSEEDVLLSHSQLSVLSEEEEEEEIDISQNGNDKKNNDVVKKNNSNNNNNNNNNDEKMMLSQGSATIHTFPIMQRFGSILSQKSVAFSELIVDTNDVLGGSEFENWIDHSQLTQQSQLTQEYDMNDIDDNGNDDDDRMLAPCDVDLGDDHKLLTLDEGVNDNNNGDNNGDNMVESPTAITVSTVTKGKAVEFGKNVRVGVGVLVKDPKNTTKVFAGTRKNSHGSGSLALPGGHLEMNEEWAECAAREVHEETGLTIHNIKFIHATNDIMTHDQKHYVTIFMAAECVHVEDRNGIHNVCPKNCEPDKCEGWNSYSLDDLCAFLNNNAGGGIRLFGPLKHLLQERPNALVEFLSLP